MRSYRPSRSAMLAVGAVTITLLVAGTSGAVAGKLITSQDIKDGTIKTRDMRNNSITNSKIAPGAVDWEKSLSDQAKEQIEALVGSGVAGPAGPAGVQGPAGPAGPAGAQGPVGPAGMGELVFWDNFANTPGEYSVDSLEDFVMEPSGGEQAELTQPGDYLVTVRGGTYVGGPGTAPVGFLVGEPGGGGFDGFLNACFTQTNAVPDFPLATCSTTYPLSAPAGTNAADPVELPTFAAPMVTCSSAETCLAEVPPAYASVAIYRVNATPTAEPGVGGPCLRAMRSELRGTLARC